MPTVILKYWVKERIFTSRFSEEETHAFHYGPDQVSTYIHALILGRGYRVIIEVFA